MNTEQLKTDNDRINETLHKHFVAYGVMKSDETLDDELEPEAWAAMQSALSDFASQESKRAVDEFKEKLRKEVLLKSDDLYEAADHNGLSDKIYRMIDKL